MHIDAYATMCIKSSITRMKDDRLALGDAILACLTERPMTGYELAKTFDASLGFFWKADHQQIYRELSKLRERGHIQSREVVQSGKPNKLVYTLTPEGRAALKHWAARPSRATRKRFSSAPAIPIPARCWPARLRSIPRPGASALCCMASCLRPSTPQQVVPSTSAAPMPQRSARSSVRNCASSTGGKWPVITQKP